MKQSIKFLLLTTALLGASGIVLAARGPGWLHGPGYYGMGPGQHCLQGGPGARGMRGPGGSAIIDQLDGLTDDQKQQISELRNEQQQRMLEHRQQRLQQRAQMKERIDAILTEAQREQLQAWRPYR